ncbi:MAG: hypothetical protein DRP93_00250, partial [Candidatus Neomarinimicrobiota bacterium]
MTQRIVLKRSNVPGKVPLTTDLEFGEIAVNTADGRMYVKYNDGPDQIAEFKNALELQNLLDGKADLVSGAIADNFAALDVDGNLTDSGFKASDFATIVHTHLEVDITDLDKYTQVEVDTLLSDKAELVHTHLEVDITDLDKYTQVEVDTNIGAAIT